MDDSEFHSKVSQSVASLNDKVDRVEDRVEKLDEKVHRLGARNDERFDRLDGRTVELDRKVAVVETNIVNIRESFGRLEGDVRAMRESIDLMHSHLRGNMRFMIGVLISFFTTLIGFGAAILGVMAKALHWLP